MIAIASGMFIWTILSMFDWLLLQGAGYFTNGCHTL